MVPAEIWPSPLSHSTKAEPGALSGTLAAAIAYFFALGGT